MDTNEARAYEYDEDKKHTNKCKSLKGEKCDCDGFHTFDELYEHRIQLYITLCKAYENDYGGVWKSKFHSDGSNMDGWFILGIHKEKGKQITYHLPLDKWKKLKNIKTLRKAPEYDGHTSDDVLKRLDDLFD
jgi:hypothetical protein